MYFAAVFIASLVLSTSGLVTPRVDVSRRHAQLAKARSAEPAPIAAPVPIDPLVPREVTKRSLRKRCIARQNSTSLSSASTPAASPSSAAPAPINVAPAPSVQPSSSAAPKPSSSAKPSPSPAPAPAPSHSSAAPPPPPQTSAPPPPPPPPPAPKPTTSSAAPPPPPPPPAPSPSPSPPPSSGGGGGSAYTGSHSGDGTFYATGLGACGITNNDSQFIVAISHTLFDGAPGYDGVNPNTNPLCNKQLSVNYMGQSTTVTITDRCVGCAEFDLDFAPAAFNVLANPAIGRLHDVSWSWLD